MSGAKGRSGRPRISAAEHALRGTYRASVHGAPDWDRRVPGLMPDDAMFGLGGTPEPGASSAGEVAMPAGLVKAERAYWVRFAPLLASARTLTPADVETLADYCRACVAVDDRGRRLRTALRRREPEPAL